MHESNVNREAAKQILENFSNEQGVYLVRRTQRDENIMVLSLIYNGEFFNYEICIKDQLINHSTLNSNIKFYFIDDGPYFRGLSQLIEHYTKYEDGLPCLLRRPVSSQQANNIKNNNSFSTSNKIMPQLTKQVIQNKPSFQPSSMSLANSSMNGQNMTSSSMIINSPPEQSFSQISSSTLVNNNDGKTDTFAKTSLFKTRALLNDQSTCFTFHITSRTLNQDQLI